MEQAGIPGPEIYSIYECLGSPNIDRVVIEALSAGDSIGTNQRVTIKLQAGNC